MNTDPTPRSAAPAGHPQPIDLTTWPRAEHFEHYRVAVPCTYAITVEIDVTALVAALRAAGRKTYPAQIWALAAVVNRHQEFRLTLDADRRPATWPVLHPAFTVLNPDRETFACVWTRFEEDFGAFHGRVVDLLNQHRDATRMFPQGERPPDTFDVSSLPWTSFTAFDLHIGSGTEHFLPIFTLGRHLQRDDRMLLPLAVQVHHAAVDGFHVARLVNDLRDLVAAPDWVA
jgi:chloramphenicol O-acetyltransferase type A